MAVATSGAASIAAFLVKIKPVITFLDSKSTFNCSKTLFGIIFGVPFTVIYDHAWSCLFGLLYLTTEAGTLENPEMVNKDWLAIVELNLAGFGAGAKKGFLEFIVFNLKVIDYISNTPRTLINHQLNQ